MTTPVTARVCAFVATPAEGLRGVAATLTYDPTARPYEITITGHRLSLTVVRGLLYSGTHKWSRTDGGNQVTFPHPDSAEFTSILVTRPDRMQVTVRRHCLVPFLADTFIAVPAGTERRWLKPLGTAELDEWMQPCRSGRRMPDLTCQDLATRIVALLGLLGDPIQPIDDKSETDVVDNIWAKSPRAAELYMREHLSWVLALLGNPPPGDDVNPVTDARIALGGWGRLQQLQEEAR